MYDTKQEITRRWLTERGLAAMKIVGLQINENCHKALLEHLKIQQKSEDEGNTESLQEYTASAPVYNSTGRYKRKLTDEIKTLIQEQAEKIVARSDFKVIKWKIDI